MAAVRTARSAGLSILHAAAMRPGFARAPPAGRRLCVSAKNSALVQEKIKGLTSSNGLVVFSKSYCPYCIEVKSLLSGKGAKFTVLELDNMGGAPQSRPAKGPGGADFATTTAAEGGDIQSALATMTGQRTVPSVWIGNQHVGGCDATKALDAQGKLVPMLKAAGVV